MKRLLVTGPTRGLGRYADAAREAGWEAVEQPLVRIEPRAAALEAVLDEPFDLVAVTSANALPALDGHVAHLGATPCAAVGPRTGDALRALGLRVQFETSGTAVDLADALLAELPRGARVLWPRGELALELGQRLRAGGLEVVDVVVYATLPAPPGPLPRADAVFLASPSAVRALAEHGSPPLAIAIGPTTATAIRETYGEATTCVVLSSPTPDALSELLERLP